MLNILREFFFHLFSACLAWSQNAVSFKGNTSLRVLDFFHIGSFYNNLKLIVHRKSTNSKKTIGEHLTRG